MTDPITTPEQMREAAAQAADDWFYDPQEDVVTDPRLGATIRAIPIAPQPVWPDFIAPSKYVNPDPRWVDPALPDFRLIWKVARECGYAVGLHGSMKRDCDLIAVPWTDEAVLAFDLIACLCKALNAQVLGPVAGKPHGRLGWNLQVDGYVKVIDISVVPRSVDKAIAPQPVAVTVKPLVWTGTFAPNERCRYDHCEAITPTSTYRVQWKSWKDYDGFVLYRDDDFLIAGDTLEAAKFAAQVDYESRVLSAIDATPARDVRAAALREAAEVCAGIRTRIANGPMPEGARFDYEQAILALIDKEAAK